jgi:hypothetical protein
VEVLRLEAQLPPDEIGRRAVEPGTDEDNVRFEGAQGGDDDLREGGAEAPPAAGLARPRERVADPHGRVDVDQHAVGVSLLRPEDAAVRGGEEEVPRPVVLEVHGGVEGVGVAFEDLGRAVAEVGVEVDHGHPAQAVLDARVVGPDGDVVEQAEAVIGTPTGATEAARVVARRTDAAEGVLDPSHLGVGGVGVGGEGVEHVGRDDTRGGECVDW